MDGRGRDVAEMPVLLPMQLSPDIVAVPGTTPFSVRPQHKISEAHCERAVFIWEIREDTFPLPVIPPKFIVNPLEPERDSSLSIVDLMERVPSGRFIRGQEINKPTEWQIYLEHSHENDYQEKNLQMRVTCEKIYIQSSVHVLAKVSCEIIDDECVPIWSSGDVYDSEVLPFSQGGSICVTLGSKTYLQERQPELVKNGTLRFRVRLNIYKDLNHQHQQSKYNENERPPLKRQRLESSVSSGLADLLNSLDSLWNNREQNGDVTILCGEQEIKAHRFILSGRSKVFMEMLNNRMNSQEKSSCVIKVDDAAPEIILAMLEFLYLSTTSRFDWTNIDHVCALIYTADKYWITPLMTRCYQGLMKMMTLDNFSQIAKVAFMYNCEKQFKDEVRHFFESHQITLNDVDSFRKFAHEDFDYFCKLFFYVP